MIPIHTEHLIPSHAQTRRSMLLMTLGMASFIVNDSLVKYLCASLSVPQTIFVGVLLVVQPAAEGFNRWALLAVLATLLQLARDLTTPSIDARTSTLLVTVSTTITVTCVAGLVCVVLPWQPLTGTQFAMLAITSVFLVIGYFFSFAALRVGEMSAVAPFRYTALLFALLSGWLVWRELPNALAWAGIVLLILSGLVIARAGRG